MAAGRRTGGRNRRVTEPPKAPSVLRRLSDWLFGYFKRRQIETDQRKKRDQMKKKRETSRNLIQTRISTRIPLPKDTKE